MVLCEQVVAREKESKGLQDQVNALQKRLEDSEHLLEKAESDFKESQEKGKK